MPTNSCNEPCVPLPRNAPISITCLIYIITTTCKHYSTSCFIQYSSCRQNFKYLLYSPFFTSLFLFYQNTSPAGSLSVTISHLLLDTTILPIPHLFVQSLYKNYLCRSNSPYHPSKSRRIRWLITGCAPHQSIIPIFP